MRVLACVPTFLPGLCGCHIPMLPPDSEAGDYLQTDTDVTYIKKKVLHLQAPTDA